MRIGEFVQLVNTTKDTVRHYENMNLLNPKWVGHRRDYQEKEVNDFRVIVGLKSMGLSIKDIQLLFQLKETFGCGKKELILGVYQELMKHLDVLKKEEDDIRKRRMLLENEMEELKAYL